MIPLADKMRPKSLSDYIDQIFSMIFWGPPGVGKTTLARIIANELKSEFLEFSATNTSISEDKKIVEGMQKPGQLLTFPIVFIDKIHRFNKLQQDAFLPLVETGKNNI